MRSCDGQTLFGIRSFKPKLQKWPVALVYEIPLLITFVFAAATMLFSQITKAASDTDLVGYNECPKL
jgi:hypothetical protein